MNTRIRILFFLFVYSGLLLDWPFSSNNSYKDQDNRDDEEYVDEAAYCVRGYYAQKPKEE